MTKFMYRFLLFFAFFYIAHLHLLSQVTPKENDTLNYRLIGFSFPAKKEDKKFTVQIASGNYTNNLAFSKNIIKTISGEKNKIIAAVPTFGANYTWRVTYTGASSKPSQSKFYHFSVAYDSVADTARVRMRVTKSAEKYKDAYFFSDGSRTMYDMDGNPLWFVPNVGKLMKRNSLVRDLKLTPQGTITMLVDGKAVEIDYNGKILWEGPAIHKEKSDTLKGYHHEFTRLGNGHYMVLSFEPFLKPKPHAQPRD